MKKFFKITVFVMLSLVLLLAVLAVSAAVFSKDHYSRSVGIIGGADGPTAILVSRNLVWETPAVFLLTAGAGFFIVAVICWLLMKNR